MAKLTISAVREIRRLHAEGRYTFVSLGFRFGVTEGSIRNIVKGKTWRHAL